MSMKQIRTLLEGSLKLTPLNVTLGGLIHWGVHVRQTVPQPIGGVRTNANAAIIEITSTRKVIRVQQKKRPQQRARDP